MWLTELKTVLVEAMRRTFDEEFPIPEFRGLPIGIEFPVEPQDYPGIWVDYEPVGELRIAGIDHREYAVPGDEEGSRRYTRWRFQGFATYTVVALTSLHRDRLFDEVVRVMAFNRGNDQISEFRSYIESNEFLAMNFDFDEIGLRGFAASPGTPWGTDDPVYEATIAMEAIGEFVSDGSTGTLVPLEGVEVVEMLIPGQGTAFPDEEGWV